MYTASSIQFFKNIFLINFCIKIWTGNRNQERFLFSSIDDNIKGPVYLTIFVSKISHQVPNEDELPKFSRLWKH